MSGNLVKLKNILMASSPVRKYDVIIVILMVRPQKSGKCSLFLCFLFGWIKLKFGIRGNFALLISNPNSKTQYQFEILRK